MKYFDFSFTYEDNKKRYKSLCMEFHPDKPTGDANKFIEMKNEWEEYQKHYQNPPKKSKLNIKVNPVSTSAQDLHDLFDKVEKECVDEEQKELLKKARKTVDNPTFENLVDLAFSFYKKKKR